MHAMGLLLLISLPGLACGGSAAPVATTATDEAPAATAAGDPHAAYAELEVGADYLTWTRVNREPFVSPTHGGRHVDVYVNEVGRAAYLDDEAEIPVGTVVVKASWEVADGERTEVPGPIFVMEKRAPGFDAEHGDWWYALHWADVPEGARGMRGARQAYWRSPSKKVGYCSGCHDDYDRQLGGVPAEHRVALD